MQVMTWSTYRSISNSPPSVIPSLPSKTTRTRRPCERRMGRWGFAMMNWGYLAWKSLKVIKLSFSLLGFALSKGWIYLLPTDMAIISWLVFFFSFCLKRKITVGFGTLIKWLQYSPEKKPSRKYSSFNKRWLLQLEDPLLLRSRFVFVVPQVAIRFWNRHVLQVTLLGGSPFQQWYL